MYLNSLFLVMQFIIVGVKNGLVQGLNIFNYPIPDQCDSACTPAAELYDSCTAVSCLCTTESDTEIQQCLNCAIPANPSLASQVEPMLEEFSVLCPNFPSLTFPPTTMTSVIAPTVTTPTVTTPTAPSVSASQVTPSTEIKTTVAPSSASGTTVGSSSVAVVPLPSNVNGAELSVQFQLGSMGIAIGISLLLGLF